MQTSCKICQTVFKTVVVDNKQALAELTRQVMEHYTSVHPKEVQRVNETINQITLLAIWYRIFSELTSTEEVDPELLESLGVDETQWKDEQLENATVRDLYPSLKLAKQRMSIEQLLDGVAPFEDVPTGGPAVIVPANAGNA